MPGSDLVMYDNEFQKIDGELQRLHQQANANVVFLVDKNGQLIASAGDTHNIDTTSLASLTAGNIAATGGNSKASWRKGIYDTLSRRGKRQHPYIIDWTEGYTCCDI